MTTASSAPRHITTAPSIREMAARNAASWGPPPPGIASTLATLLGPTVRQMERATCWKCGKTWPGTATERYQIDVDSFPVCVNEDACDERAARAGLLLVLSAPGDGGVA